MLTIYGNWWAVRGYINSPQESELRVKLKEVAVKLAVQRLAPTTLWLGFKTTVMQIDRNTNDRYLPILVVIIAVVCALRNNKSVPKDCFTDAV